MKRTRHDTKTSLAKMLFDYLYLQDIPSKANAMMGFGHFDEKIPLHCGTLYSNGFAPFILFSGGIGAGSTGLKKPEAHEFFEKLCRQFPNIPRENIILEDRSTNTSENIQYTLLLLDGNPTALPAKNIKKLIITANAYRQRRVWLTCRKILKNVELINSPPLTDFEKEFEMYQYAGEDLCMHLKNEIERIITYPAKGFIEYSNIPDDIISIYEKLRELI